MVQGAGGVGRPLIDMLRAAGATVIVTDVDPDRLRRLADENIRVVPPEKALITDCDVLAPCATGGVINERSIPQLSSRVVAGAANNQLEKPADAELLRERGIAYAPDFVINSGGVLHGGGLEEQGWTRAELAARLAGIGDAVYAIFKSAETDGVDTDTAARRLAQAHLSRVQT